MSIVLRPFTADDLPMLPGGGSPFDDWGPRRQTDVLPFGLDAAGGLVVTDADQSVLGLVSWHYVQWGPTGASRNPMIGVWLRPEARGRGTGTEAQSDLVDLFFRHTNVNRVEAHTDVENVAEQRALEKAGFLREGVTRGAQWRDGAFRDGLLYSILRSDRLSDPGRGRATPNGPH